MSRDAEPRAGRNVTARCAVCREALADDARRDARYCGDRCRQQAQRWRNRDGRGPARRSAELAALSVTVNPGCEDDGEPGQLREPAIELAADLWEARGTRWALELAGDTFVLQAEDTTILRPPWPMRNRAQARGWARVVLSTPRGPAERR